MSNIPGDVIRLQQIELFGLEGIKGLEDDV